MMVLPATLWALSVIPLCLAQCKDGPHCNEILNVRFTFASRATKCSLWVYGLAPDLFTSELTAPELNRLMTFSYCPISCSYPCPTTAKSSSTMAPLATPVQMPTATKVAATTSLSSFPNTSNSKSANLTTRSVSSSPFTTSTPRVPSTKITVENSDQFLANILQRDSVFKELLKQIDETNTDEALSKYSLYQTNKATVDKHNQMFSAGLVSYSMALNKFSLMGPDEIAPNALSIPPTTSTSLSTRKKRQVNDGPVDWRPFMQNVTDQKNCGGCWAFAMTAMLEGALAIRGLSSLPLSVQQLLNCDRAINPIYNLANQGCSGGYLNVATDYLSKKPLKAASLYPFTGTSSSSCRLDVSGAPLLSSFDAAYTASDDPSTLNQLNQEMEERVRLGPVAVGFANSEQIYAYGSGVFDGPCGKSINHAVVIVGFTDDYWIVRNSWGSNWGEQGYIRIKRVPGKDPCQLVQYWATAAPILKVPSQNHVVVSTEETVEKETTVATETVEKIFCDGEDCDYCGCEDDDDDDDEENRIENSTAFVWTSTVTF